MPKEYNKMDSWDTMCAKLRKQLVVQHESHPGRIYQY